MPESYTDEPWVPRYDEHDDWYKWRVMARESELPVANIVNSRNAPAIAHVMAASRDLLRACENDGLYSVVSEGGPGLLRIAADVLDTTGYSDIAFDLRIKADAEERAINKTRPDTK